MCARWMMTRCEALPGKPLEYDRAVTLIVYLCVKDLRIWRTGTGGALWTICMGKDRREERAGHGPLESGKGKGNERAQFFGR